MNANNRCPATRLDADGHLMWHYGAQSRWVRLFVPEHITGASMTPEEQISASINWRMDCDQQIVAIRQGIRDDKIDPSQGRKEIFRLKRLSRFIDEDFFR
jgi:hypothetical protein